MIRRQFREYMSILSSFEASYTSQKVNFLATKIAIVIHGLNVDSSHLLLLIEPPGTSFNRYKLHVVPLQDWIKCYRKKMQLYRSYHYQIQACTSIQQVL